MEGECGVRKLRRGIRTFFSRLVVVVAVVAVVVNCLVFGGCGGGFN